jgi:hypothetical protein
MHAAITDHNDFRVDSEGQRPASRRDLRLALPAMLSGMRLAAQQRRWQDVRAQAQRIRGDAERLGLTRLAQAAARLDYTICDERMPAEI